jgi:hypothetical protein
MPLRLAIPDWPAEKRGGAHLRRFGLPYFVLFSLLAHGLALLLKLEVRPHFPIKVGKANLSVELRPPRQIPTQQPDLTPRALPKTRVFNSPRSTDNLTTAATPRPGTIEMRQPPAGIDTTDLIERSKADLNAASRRQMLDPMFAPSARHAPQATPLERATTIADTKIEERGAYVIRVTNADGSRYCLQRLPEIATRDIPVPLVGVPMKCQ